MIQNATLSTAMQASGFSENINVTKYTCVALDTIIVLAYLHQTSTLVKATSLKTNAVSCIRQNKYKIMHPCHQLAIIHTLCFRKKHATTLSTIT